MTQYIVGINLVQKHRTPPPPVARRNYPRTCPEFAATTTSWGWRS